MHRVTVRNTTRDFVIGDSVVVAHTSLSRMVGLLGKPGLEAGGGLWIKPSSGVHTIGMRFTIDVIGLDKHGKVIRLWPNLVPYRLTSINMKVQSVIELAAGRIAETNVQIGDVLAIS